MTTHARWSKSSPSWGSALRVQRNVYALRVTLAMTDGKMECPTCGDTLILDGAASQVDRVDPTLDYCESNILYVCEGCNAGRGVLQASGRDWTHVAAYAADVAKASASVSVPTQTEAKREWDARPRTAHRASRYA